MPQVTLVSVQVGTPLTRGVPGARHALDRPWTSGIFKEPVSGRLRLGRTNLLGDAQADLAVHGGPDKAVCVYAASHYPFWRERLNRPDFPYGAFGENFTVSGLEEPDVAIGDVFAVGEARVQVSQPRQPCWKLARKWRLKDLTAQVEASGRTGWYFRVLEEGSVGAGDALQRLERPFPQWTVARANLVLRAGDPVPALELAACPVLAESWRSGLRRLAAATPAPTSPAG